MDITASEEFSKRTRYSRLLFVALALLVVFLSIVLIVVFIHFLIPADRMKGLGGLIYRIHDKREVLQVLKEPALLDDAIYLRANPEV